MPARNFFSTKTDIEPGLRLIDQKLKVKYIERGLHSSPDCVVYYSALDLPNLGLVASCAASGNPQYLVLPVETEIVIEPVKQFDGTTLYWTGFELNRDAFWFRPGGWHGNAALLGGDIAMLRSSDKVYSYYRPFAQALTKGFVTMLDALRYKWYVGPEALSLLNQGIRLITRDASAPGTSEDLKRP